MQKKKNTPYQEAKQKLAGLLQLVAKKHSLAKVFLDFMEMFALAISNRIDTAQFERREARYLDIVRAYDKEELDTFAEAMAILVLGLQAVAKTGRMQDMLGELYVEIGMNDSYKAQVFTPQHLADLMGHLILADTESQEGANLSLYDGTVGSGALVLGYVNALIDREICHFTRVTVEAVDIDPVCVHMAYIQLSLYGIAAKVKHGNTITVETFDTWYTPMYILRGCGFRGEKAE